MPQHPTKDDEEEKDIQTGLADLARGVKNVVLHDARNIKGKEGRISGKNLAFDVGSASAAKVSFLFLFESYKRLFATTTLITLIFSASGQIDLHRLQGKS